MSEENRLEVRKVVEEKIMALQLNGIIDESFNGKQLAEGLKETLIVDLSGVRRISSFGIREWLEFLKVADAKCETIYYIQCPSRIIDQFNMVANFGGKGQVVSFYAPYHCDFCDEDHSVLVDVTDQHDNIKESTLPDRECATCGEAEYLDEDAETYLSYLSTQDKPEPDAEVIAFLSHRLRYKVTRSRQKLKVDMHIGAATYIRFMGDLDASFLGKKIAEGKEGKIVLDLNGVGDITDEAVQTWVEMMRIMEPNVDTVYVIGAAATFMEKLLIPDAMAGGKVKIVDLFLPYTCEQCNTTTDQHLNVDEHFDVLKFATAPELKCPDCAGKCVSTVEEGLLTKLSTLQKPEMDKGLIKFVDEARAAIKKASAPVKAAASEAEIKGGSNVGLVIALLFIIAAVSAGGWFLYTKISKKDKGIKEKIEFLSASNKTKPTWLKNENSIDTSGGSVVVYTMVDDVSSPDQGISQATGWALDLYVEYLSDQIAAKDAVWKTVVKGLYYQPREDLLNQYKNAGSDMARRREMYRQIKEYHRALSKSFKIAFGKDIVPSPGDIYYEKYLKTSRVGTRNFHKVWIKLEFPKNVTKKMVAYFSTKKEFEGVTVVNFFPGLNWAFTKTVRGPLVIGMSPKSKFNGILKVGYILTQLQNEPLAVLADFPDKFASLHKLQLANNQCNLTFHFKFWRADTQDILASTSQYNWKCPDKVKTKVIYKNNGSGMNLNTGFQGNIWNDPSK